MTSIVAATAGLVALVALHGRSFDLVVIGERDGCELRALVSSGAASGQWVVVTHGNRAQGQSHPLYKALRSMIPRSHHVLALDLAGFGSSICSPDAGNYDPDRVPDLVMAITYLVDRFGIEPSSIVLLGHSIGAVLSLSAASHYEDGPAVIAISPGDLSEQLRDSESLSRYAKRMEDTTGLPTTIEAVVQLRDAVAPVVLARADSGRKAFIVAEHDVSPLLVDHDDFSAHTSVVIPRADHMFGTEGGYWSKAVLSPLLLLQLRREIRDALRVLQPDAR